MRRIKFRAWTNKWGMVYPDNDGMQIDVHAAIVWEDLRDEENVTLMQFTGLLDKNMKEIYEGDVVKWENGSMIGEIWWQGNAGYWAIDWKANGEGNNGHPFEHQPNDRPKIVHSRQMEVIGNIYESPELLPNEQPSL